LNWQSNIWAINSTKKRTSGIPSGRTNPKPSARNKCKGGSKSPEKLPLPLARELLTLDVLGCSGSFFTVHWRPIIYLKFHMNQFVNLRAIEESPGASP
jgi:hypothetical protein